MKHSNSVSISRALLVRVREHTDCALIMLHPVLQHYAPRVAAPCKRVEWLLTIPAVLVPPQRPLGSPVSVMAGARGHPRGTRHQPRILAHSCWQANYSLLQQHIAGVCRDKNGHPIQRNACHREYFCVVVHVQQLAPCFLSDGAAGAVHWLARTIKHLFAAAKIQATGHVLVISDISRALGVHSGNVWGPGAHITAELACVPVQAWGHWHMHGGAHYPRLIGANRTIRIKAPFALLIRRPSSCAEGLSAA